MPKDIEQLSRSLVAGRIGRRDFLAGASALGLSVAASQSLFARSAHAAPKKGGHLRVGVDNGETTDSLDPATYPATFMMCTGFATHSTLTEISPSGELAGDLAEEWSSSPDASTWTFKLRKGAEFSNGRPVTADDVVASLNHHRGEESTSAAKTNVAPIENLRSDGKDTLVVELSSSNADFPYLMADYHLLVMPEVDGKADWEVYVGSGGYVLDTFEPGVRVELKKNPNYWKDGRGHVDTVEILAILDTNARQNAVISGAVDVINNCDLKTVELLAKKPGVRVEESTGFQHYTIPMHTNRAPFDSNDVRLAVKYALDREQLLKVILKGHGTLGNDTPIAPSVPFYAEQEQRHYDPDKARFHLKEAGYDRLALDLSTADVAGEGAIGAASLMKEQAAPAGIDINIVREPNDGYWSNVWMQKPFSMCNWGGRPTCDWMFSTAYAEGVPWNDTFWSHERFNKLLVAGRSELDTAKRAEIYAEMQRILRDEGGTLVWAFTNYVNAVSDKIGHGPDVASNWNLDGGRFIERWWFA